MVKCREKFLCILFFREKAPYLQCTTFDIGDELFANLYQIGIFLCLSVFI
nr:MAG TPA: hypothetical protein [Caudoviricetes sp.]